MIELPIEPRVSPAWHRRLTHLEAATRSNPPRDLAAVVRGELLVDLTARYAGISIPHPFGKASGQLSHRLHQVQSDVDAGLAFIVLKTVIAEDPRGARRMKAWATHDTKMQVERITSRSGRDGWTVTWEGRGWGGSLEEYGQFFRQAQLLGNAHDVPIIPSVKYDLPAAREAVHAGEYMHTTGHLLEVWDDVGCGGEMVLEKDLSPTLAGTGRAADREQVLHWLTMIPQLIDRAAPGRVRLGIKLMNALFDDEFQLDMMRTVTERARPMPAFLVVFNRLFDPVRKRAFGGWDLSDRNLRVLESAREFLSHCPALSATGNICSGRVMVEYALRGCENGQLHTFFQLPLSEYTATGGSRSSRALHTLLLHPTQGLAVWLRHLQEIGAVESHDGAVRFLDVVALSAVPRV